MGVTTKDLARICGVSRTTITRALYGTGSIRADTKQKILETARELGYQPDLTARSLVSGKSMSIGVIVVDLKNQYFPKMLDAIEKKVKEYDYLLNITLHEDSREVERKLLRTLTGHRVDGLIIAPVSQEKEFWDYLEHLPIPVVVIGKIPGAAVPMVGTDEERMTREAVEYIYRKGYRDIVFVAPPLRNESSLESVGHRSRAEGYRKAAERLGIPQRIIMGDDYEKEALRYREQTGGRPAFLCSGDIYAIRLLCTLREQGYREREDFGVMGFDYIDLIQKWSPRLCTVNNHVEEIGRRAAELLLDLIQGTAGEHRIEIPYEIVDGETL